MPVRFVRPVSRSAYAARRLGFLALAIFAGAALAHRFGPLTTPDFLTLLLVSAALAALAALLALHGLLRLWQVGAKGGVASITALFFAAPPLSLAVAGLWLDRARPALYDISSDTTNPPDWITPPQADQQWLERPASVLPVDRALQAGAYPALTGRRYEGALDRVYRGVTAAALSARIAISERRGLELIAEDSEPRPESDSGEGEALLPEVAPIPIPRPAPSLTPVFADADDVLLQGEIRSLLLGFPFDVVIRLDEDAETTSVDIRVAARYGDRDLGYGAAIAGDFLNRLDSELLGIVSR